MGIQLLSSKLNTQAYLPMAMITPCMLENCKTAQLNFAYILWYSLPITGYGANYTVISKPLKPYTMEVYLQGSKQNTQAKLPMGFTTKSIRLRNWTLHISLDIVYPLLSTRRHYNVISKPLKPKPTEVNLVGSKQDIQA